MEVQLKVGELLINRNSAIRKHITAVSDESFFVNIAGREVEYDNWMIRFWVRTQTETNHQHTDNERG